MGEEEQISYTQRSWEAYDNQLQAPALAAALDLTETTPGPPSYQFDLEPRRFIGTGITEITDDAVLRYSLRVLEETCASDHPKYNGLSEKRVRETQLRTAQTYINAVVNVGGGEKKKRADFVDIGSALDEVEAMMELSADPAQQLLTQIRGQFGEEMKQGLFQTLRRNMIVMTQWQSLRERLAQQTRIEKARNAALSS